MSRTARTAISPAHSLTVTFPESRCRLLPSCSIVISVFSCRSAVETSKKRTRALAA